MAIPFITKVMFDMVHLGVLSLISVSWIQFRSPGQQNKLNLDGIVGKEDPLFKSCDKLTKTYQGQF